MNKSFWMIISACVGIWMWRSYGPGCSSSRSLPNSSVACVCRIFWPCRRPLGQWAALRLPPPCEWDTQQSSCPQNLRFRCRCVSWTTRWESGRTGRWARFWCTRLFWTYWRNLSEWRSAGWICPLSAVRAACCTFLLWPKCRRWGVDRGSRPLGSLSVRLRAWLGFLCSFSGESLVSTALSYLKLIIWLIIFSKKQNTQFLKIGSDSISVILAVKGFFTLKLGFK